ncbi:MAG: hypothetical protein ACO3A2_11345 [Bdellovibrionia bacterium]
MLQITDHESSTPQFMHPVLPPSPSVRLSDGELLYSVRFLGQSVIGSFLSFIVLLFMDEKSS